MANVIFPEMRYLPLLSLLGRSSVVYRCVDVQASQLFAEVSI